jgi:hypothetical protein
MCHYSASKVAIANAKLDHLVPNHNDHSKDNEGDVGEKPQSSSTKKMMMMKKKKKK